MGTTAGDKALEVDYPLAFGNAFSSTLVETNQRFRYIHLSGAATERDQERPLWFKAEMRKLKVFVAHPCALPPSLPSQSTNSTLGPS